MDTKALITEFMFGSDNPSTTACSDARLILYKKTMRKQADIDVMAWVIIERKTREKSAGEDEEQ